MSTAPTLSKQMTAHTVVRGVRWGLIASAAALSWNAPNDQHVIRIGADRDRLTEICRWDGSPRAQSGYVKASKVSAVGQWLRELEQQLGLSRAGLAALLDVSRPTLYSWERGEGLRRSNAEKLQSLRTAAKILVDNAPGGVLPALWQHQKLPGFGMSFAQGMLNRQDPEGMAHTIVKVWERDAVESQAVERLFADRV